MWLVDKAKAIAASMKNGAISVASWAKTIPSEPNGNGSSSRFIALMTASTVMGVIIAYFHYHHDFPTPGQLYGIASILGTGIGAYVANKMRPKDGGGDGDDSHGDPDASHQ